MEFITGYHIAWGLYLVFAVGLVIVFWRLTRAMRSTDLKKALRALVAVILFTPVNTGAHVTWLAPAYLVSGYEWIQGHTQLAMQGGYHLLAALAFMCALIALEHVVRKLIHLQES